MIDPTEISLPTSIKYPIEVTAIVENVGTNIAKHSTILRYKYKDRVLEAEATSDTPAVYKEKEFFSTFESPIEGEIQRWLVNRNDMVTSCKQPIVRIIEPCTHAVQYSGLCAICGSVLDEQDYTEFKNTDRAPISMSHNTTGLKVSYDEAERIEKTSTQQLLTDRKLILVVDLDQTVIHAAVDPTIGEWMSDPSHPEYKNLQQVKTFTLDESLPEHHPHRSGPSHPSVASCRYYIKLRPGLDKFLSRMAENYEMHIYTMATKAYAKAVASLIDPEGKYFADRILSRDESGSLLQKNLKRLFPVSTNMVAIIDDRGDVWKWSSHLVKVNPYNYFLGIGDINSGIPSQKLDLKKINETKKTSDDQSPTTNNEQDKDAIDESTESRQRDLEGIDPEAGDQILEGERSATLEAQQAERPLAKLQQQIEEQHSSQHVLNDHDNELSHLDKALLEVHAEFYKEYDQKKDRKDDDLPDLSVIIPRVKRQLFEGCVFLFSGHIPLGTNFENIPIVQWVRSFGAVVVANLVPSVTHVIAKNPGTYKVRYAAWYPKIKIVNLEWVYACLKNWGKVPEDKFTVHVPNPLPPVEEKGGDGEDKVPFDGEVDEPEVGQDGDRFRRSLGNINWADADKELEEFMGSDDEDDDEEEEANDTDGIENVNDEGDEDRIDSRKRTRDSDDEPFYKRPKHDTQTMVEDSFDDDEFARELEGAIG